MRGRSGLMQDEMVEKKENKTMQETSLEEAFAQLEQIINTMEQDDLPLEEAFTLYEQGLKKLKLCNEKLDLVEKKMQILGNNGELIEFE